MNIEKIVEEHARKLKEEVGTALNGDECFDLINDAVTEAIELVKANSVLGGVSETAEECLKQIADPINHIREQAEKDGCTLDGMMAVRMSEDANYLKQIAVKWLESNSR